MLGLLWTSCTLWGQNNGILSSEYVPFPINYLFYKTEFYENFDGLLSNKGIHLN